MQERCVESPSTMRRSGSWISLRCQPSSASRDVTGDLITVRIRVPDASMGAVKGLKPSEWVTVMARQRPATDARSYRGRQRVREVAELAGRGRCTARKRGLQPCASNHPGGHVRPRPASR